MGSSKHIQNEVRQNPLYAKKAAGSGFLAFIGKNLFYPSVMIVMVDLHVYLFHLFKRLVMVGRFIDQSVAGV